MPVRSIALVLAPVLAVVAPFPCAVPAAAAPEQDEQVWINLTATGPVRGDLVYFAEVQPRAVDGASRIAQTILRPAIGYRVTPALTLFQGYAHVVQPVPGAPNRNEDRSFQQATWVLKPGPVEIQSRTRFEQRWLKDGRDTGYRLRQMIRYEHSFAPGRKSTAFLGYAEAFVALNDTDWGARGGFDQLRSFVGVEVPIAGRSTIEAGYLNQYVDRRGVRDRMNHILSLTLFARH